MTIKEIAIIAGTSRGTVDRVLNKRGRVSKDVEQRVLDAIKATNYKTNEVARSLSLSNKKVIVGVLIATQGNSFFNLIRDGLKNASDKLKNAGMQVIIKEVDLFNKKKTLIALDELKDLGIDALAISTLNDKDICDKVDSLNVPVVAINLDIDVKNKISFVGCDYENSGRLAANFVNIVSRAGYKIGLVVGSFNHSGQAIRYQNFKKVIKPMIEIVDEKENLDDDSISYKVVKEMVEAHPDINYIVFLGAGVEGGLQALKSYDNRIKAITMDQSEEVLQGLHNNLVLASITQHPYTQGVRTVDILYDYLIRKKKVVKEKILDNSIILKESIIPHKPNE